MTILLLSSFIFQLSSCDDSEALPSVQPDALAQLPQETPISIAANIAPLHTRAASDTWYAYDEIHLDKEVNFNLFMPGGSDETYLSNIAETFKDLPTTEPFASLQLKDFNLTEGGDRCVSRWTWLGADYSGLDFLYGFARLAADADGKPVLDYGKLKRAHSKVTIRLVDSQGKPVSVLDNDGYSLLSATIRSAHTDVVPIYLTDEAGNGTDFDSHCWDITTLAADKAITSENFAMAAYEFSTELYESIPDAMVSADGQTAYYGKDNNELCAIVPPTATHTSDEDYIYFTPIATPSFTDEEKLTISVTSDPDGDGPLTTGTYTLKLKDIVLQGENGEVKTESEPSTFPLSAFRSGTHYVITVTLDHNRLVTGTAQLAAWNYTEAEVTLGGDPSYIPSLDAATTDLSVLKAAIKKAVEKNVPLVLTGTTLGEYFKYASAGLENEVPVGSIDLVLPEVTELPEYAFNGCKALRSVSAPKVTTVGERAFQACSGLTSVDLPVAKEIGVGAFSDCTALTSLELPAATTLGDGVFNSVPLTSLTFGSVIESMEFTLGNGNSENCTLTLADGQKQFKLDANSMTLKPTDAVMTAAAPTASEADRTWANKTWKEIIITPSTNNE